MALITEEESCKYYMYRISLKEDPTRDYVGVTNNYKRRWREHRNDARHGGGYYIANALGKYGIDAFDWKVIAIFRNGKIAGEMEKVAKKFLGLGYYNLADGGEGIGRLPEESEQKRIASLRKTMADPSRREARSEAIKAFHFENPEVAEKKAEQLRTLSRDPEVVARRVQTIINGYWSHPENHKIRSEISKEALNRPETRKKISEAKKKQFEDPAERRKRSQQILAYYSIPENVQKQAIAMKEMTNRPEVKAKVAIASKIRWDRVRQLGLRNLTELAEYDRIHTTKEIK